MHICMFVYTRICIDMYICMYVDRVTCMSEVASTETTKSEAGKLSQSSGKEVSGKAARSGVFLTHMLRQPRCSQLSGS